MAVVTLKSTTITNRDAVPAVINDNRLERGMVRQCRGYVTTANGDSIGSKYIIASVPSKAFVTTVAISCGALGGSAAADVGVYRNTADGGAVVSAALFGSAVSLVSALSNSDVTNESGNYTLDKQEQPLWQAAGLASDPGTTLDIAFTLTAASAAAVFAGGRVSFLDNGG